MLPLTACLALAFATAPEPLTAEQWMATERQWKAARAALEKALDAARFDLAEVESQRCLTLAKRLYPPPDFPDGHDRLAVSVSNVAYTLDLQGKWDEAEPLYRQALAMRKRLHPDGDHATVAQSLSNLGVLLGLRGKTKEAHSCLTAADEMYARLYPKGGHPAVANVKHNLAGLFLDKGMWAEAEENAKAAADMRRRLFAGRPHPDLADSLNTLAVVYKQRRKYDEAEDTYREAVALYEQLFRDRDHPARASALNNLGTLLERRGEYADAERRLEQALGMWERLYAGRDHPDVARGTGNLGHLLRARGDLVAAEKRNKQALALFRKAFPSGHTDVADALGNLAAVLHAAGRPADAEPLLREAWGISRRLTAEYAGGMAEGAALSRAAFIPNYRNAYLSVAVSLNIKPADVYAEVFADRGALSRVYEQKQLQARAAAADPTSATLLAELADARIRRAELLLAPSTTDKATLEKREDGLKAFEKVIRDKSKELLDRFKPVARAEKLAKATPADLQKALPDGAVLVDLLKWTHFEYDPKKPGKDGEKRTEKYLAFVVTKSDVKWVQLGPAKGIEEAVRVWREAITDAKTAVPAELGAKVRELVWEPIRKEFPKGVTEVYLSPDAALCRLPWVALPGDKPGTVLLEDEFAVATVPHAPFLLDHLWERDKSIQEKTELLVVGGVNFDAQFAGKLDPKAVPDERLLDPKAKAWGQLKATKAEADGLAARAEKRKQPTTLLSGDKATAEAVRAALPKAKVAHLATHGFFADPKFRSAFQLDEKDYKIGFGNERIGRAANSPLVMTGLVLAGANDPKTPGRGIVTGEGLIDLDLSGLELAVLSACETGLGDVAGGEGTFGLQRAFHTAGTRNVVVSLWSVSDSATAALMGEFYRHLWEEKLTPAQALKAAQLKVYRTARMDFGTLRGFADSGIKAEDSNFPPSKGEGVRNHPALWAAFTLSGPGK